MFARLRQLPLIVLSADRAWGPQIPSMIAAGTLPADVPQNFGYVTDAAQKEAEEKLAHLVPNAKHITDTNSGHEIHKEQPTSCDDVLAITIQRERTGHWTRMRQSLALSSKSGASCRTPCLAGCITNTSGFSFSHAQGSRWASHNPLLLAFTSRPTALELSQPCIGLPRLLSSRCRPSSLSLQRSDCHSGDPTRRTHRRLQR